MSDPLEVPNNMLLDTEIIDKARKRAKNRRLTAIGLLIAFGIVAAVLAYVGIMSYWDPKIPEDESADIICRNPGGSDSELDIFCAMSKDELRMATYESIEMGDPVLTFPEDVSEKHCSRRADVVYPPRKGGPEARTATTSHPQSQARGSITTLKTMHTILSKCEVNPKWVVHMERGADAEELASLNFHIHQHEAGESSNKPTAIFHNDPHTGKPKGSYAMNQAAVNATKQPGRAGTGQTCEQSDVTSLTVAECLKRMGVHVKTVPRVKSDDPGPTDSVSRSPA